MMLKGLNGIVSKYDDFLYVDFPSLSEANDYLTFLHEEARKLEHGQSLSGTEIGSVLHYPHKSSELFTKKVLEESEIVDVDDVPYFSSCWGFLVKIERSSMQQKRMKKLLDRIKDETGLVMTDAAEENSDECKFFVTFHEEVTEYWVTYCCGQDGSKWFEILPVHDYLWFTLSKEGMNALNDFMNTANDLDWVVPSK